MAYQPKYLYRSLSVDSNNNEISQEEIIRKMRAFRISQMIANHWSANIVAEFRGVSSDIEKLIHPNNWFNMVDENPLPLTWNQMNFSRSFTFGFH